MTSGTPLLLSGDQAGRLLCRVETKHGADQYTESFLQETIDRWPNILPIRDFYPNVEGLCSLGREIPVDLGGSEGCIDNLLVTDDGHLVIVETKLWRSPEALRTVVAQVLHYGMAVSQLPWDKFEACLRRSDPKCQQLGKAQTVFEFIRNRSEADSFPEPDDDFHDNFDTWRRNGEILLVIVADAIRPSLERLVHWMDTKAGNKPYQLGVVELCIYDLPDLGRFIVPKTSLRIREGSRITVTVNVQGVPSENVTTTIAGPGPAITVLPPQPNMTEEGLTKRIKAGNPQQIAELVETLRSNLTASGLVAQGLPASIRYGMTVNGDFIPLLWLQGGGFWFQIPMRAVRVLGDQRFVGCKRIINGVAEFYHSGEVDDPSKANVRNPKYDILKGKVDDFVKAVMEIAAIVRNAVAEAS
jgi:hypothetical protein